MRIKKRVFFIIGLLITGLYLCLILQRRLPIAHDTAQYLQLQYVFFNEICWHKQIPFWFPFVEQGMAVNYWLTIQLTILSPVIYVLALFGKGINYLYVFYAGMWFDEIFFLLGVLLLGSIYYKRWETFFFVGLTVFGSTIWYPQVFWGLHAVYFIPIVLFCFHRFLDTGLFRYFWGCALFFFLGFIGDGIYINLFVSFVLLVYFISVLSRCKEHRQHFFSFLLRGPSAKQTLAFVLLTMIIAAGVYYIKFANSQIAYIGKDRMSNGTNALYTFLLYGGDADWRKYLAFFSRDSQVRLPLDVTLYSGFFFPVFTFIGLWRGFEKKRWGLVVTALVVMLFSCGTFVSVFFYYVFPLGKVFRHIGLTAPVAKLFLIFLAGFGVEEFLRYLDHGKFRNWLFWMVLAAVVVFLLKGFDPQGKDYFFSLGILEKKILLVLRSILLIATVVVSFFWLAADRLRNRLCVLALFSVIALELITYKYASIVSLMPRVSEETAALFMPVAYSFPMTRQVSTKDYLGFNRRAQLFFSAWQKDEARWTQYWEVYDTAEAFLFTDSFASAFRGDFISAPVNSLFAGKRPSKEDGNDFSLRYYRLSAPKLGVFSSLHYAADNYSLAKILDRPSQNNRTLWTTRDQLDKIPGQALGGLGEEIPAGITVKDFSFNELKLDVHAPGPPGRPYFLYYADAYHPFWKAFVNGKESPVMVANIGYKATVIPGGHSEVVFRFGHPFFIISISCLLLLCLGVMIFSGYLFWKDIWLFKDPET